MTMLSLAARELLPAEVGKPIEGSLSFPVQRRSFSASLAYVYLIECLHTGVERVSPMRFLAIIAFALAITGCGTLLC